MLRCIVILLTLLALPGCATLSKGECRSADWFDIGVRDGANGRGEEYIARHAEACARVAVQPDRERWLEGRERGLERYCTRHNGLRVGEVGGTYDGVCFAGAEEEFLYGYRLGRELNRLKARVDELENDIRISENRLAEGEIDEEERRRLHYRLQQARYELTYARREYDEVNQQARML